MLSVPVSVDVTQTLDLLLELRLAEWFPSGGMFQDLLCRRRRRRCGRAARANIRIPQHGVDQCDNP